MYQSGSWGRQSTARWRGPQSPCPSTQDNPNQLQPSGTPIETLSGADQNKAHTGFLLLDDVADTDSAPQQRIWGKARHHPRFLAVRAEYSQVNGARSWGEVFTICKEACAEVWEAALLPAPSMGKQLATVWPVSFPPPRHVAGRAATCVESSKRCCLGYLGLETDFSLLHPSQETA